MRKRISKLFGPKKQEQEAPVSTGDIVYTTTTDTKAPPRVLDITETTDDNAVKARLDQFKAEGEVLTNSVSKNGEYEFDINGKPPVLNQLEALTAKTISSCTQIVSAAKAQYTNYRKELEGLLNLQTEEERKDAFLKRHAEAITREVSQAEKPLSEIPAKTEQMRDARGKKEEAADKRKKISEEEYDGYPPHKRAILLFLYALIVVGILPTETMLNIGALDAVESDLQARFVLPTAMTITAMIALAAHFLGVFIGNKSHKGLIGVALGAAVMMLGIVFFLRANGIESAFVLTFINVAAFLLMSGLSYIYHKDEPIFRADEAKTKWRDVESGLREEIETIKKTAKDKKAAIYDRWNAKANEAVEQQVKPLKLEILRLTSDEEAFDSYLKTRILDPIRAMHRDFTTRAEINFCKARQKNGLPVMTPDAGAEAQNEDTQVTEEESSKPQSNGQHGGNGLGRLSDLKNGLHSLLVALCCFGLTACTEDIPPKSIDVLVIEDASIAVKDSASLPTPEQQLAYILGRADFTPYEDRLSVTPDNIRVRITSIGETSFPPVQEIELESGGPAGRMVKSKRRAAQQAFINETRATIEAHTIAKGLPSSRIFDCLCRVLPPFVNAAADKKTVLIASDLLEHSEVEDFYTLHSRMPDQFARIKDRLETHCSALKDISFEGIDFTAVYLPTDKARDKSTRYARMFWEMYIKGKGGRIEFLPNLPDVKPTQITAH